MINKHWQRLDINQKYILVILLLYLISRIYLYIGLDLSFNYIVSKYLVQYADIDFLKNHLLESLFYLHSQPPLFNFLIGISEMIFGAYSNLFFLIVFQLCGISTVVFIFKFMLEMKIKPWLSFVITIIYMFTPAAILYENLFFYSHLVVFFFAASAYCLSRFLYSGKSFYLHSFFLLLLFISLTTSFFHIFWFFATALLIIFFKRSYTKKIILSAFIPVVLLAAIYAKNYFLFGDFNSSSWLGMNLSRITVYQLPEKDRECLVKKDQLSMVSLLPPFPHYDMLWNLKDIQRDIYGAAILDSLRKSGGRTNFNNSIYLKISKAAFNDSKFIILNYPQYYLKGVKKAFEIYLKPPTNYKLLNQNLFQIKSYNKFFNAFIYGASPNTPFGYFTLLLTVITLLFTTFLLIKKKLSYRIKAVLAFMILNIIYVMIVGNLLEVGENNRFRFYTELFSYVLFANIINEILPFLRKKNSQLSSANS